MLLGLGVATFFRCILSEEDLFAWGWRIPFIAGLFIGLVGVYIRSHLSESPIYKAAKAEGLLSRTPLRETLTKYRREALMAMVIYINVTAPFYIATVFIKNYMDTLGYKSNQSSVVCTLILITMTAVFPVSAHLSDKIGRKPVLIGGIVALMLSAYPVFVALQSMDYILVILSQMLFAAIIGVYMGPVPTILVELFPTRVRFTGIAISYNMSAAIFGGTAPMVGAALYKITGDELALAYYLTALAVFGLGALYFYYKETYKYDLLADVNDKRIL
jgi:MHS family proline/betaine transporter-like MFS transporter